MQVNFSPYGQPGDLWLRSKGRISLNFNYKINFEDFCTKLCVCSHKYVIKHIKRIYHCVAWVMPQGGTWGGGFQKLELWGFAMAPHRLRVIVKFCI